jgi:ABC-2 type transport system ATP-binding protein/lipopolysaccharide transport system ATP-binding protein
MGLVRLRKACVRIPMHDLQTLRLFSPGLLASGGVSAQSLGRGEGVVHIDALQEFDLELVDGDRIGLIGHNGAGKTTLLRLIAGIYTATSGAAEVIGRVTTMLGMDTALNADATGYENIRLCAELYDWPKDSLRQRIREIEEFTDLGVYLSLPTRVYSNGMRARLGLAIATACNPDILLIDETIGAGDVNFQERVRARIETFLGKASIVVLASHSAELMRRMCTKAVVLDRGRRIFFGDIDHAYAAYAGLA